MVSFFQFVWRLEHFFPDLIFFFICRGFLFYNQEFKEYCIPFMGSDGSVVKRTQRYLHTELQETPVSYCYLYTLSSGCTGLFLATWDCGWWTCLWLLAWELWECIVGFSCCLISGYVFVGNGSRESQKYLKGSLHDNKLNSVSVQRLFLLYQQSF